MAEDIFDVFNRRIRANPSGLTIYEHEIGKLVEASLGMQRGSVAYPIEEMIRASHFRYHGLPVRVHQQQAKTASPLPSKE